MPYFIEAQGDKHCVRKGSEKEPGAVVKCYPTRGEATGHMRALYANVEDATDSPKATDKATTKAAVSPVVGSMLHGSGGILNPMRSGDNEDAKTSTCICPECKYESKKIGSVACEDRICPKCGAKMQAKENGMKDDEQESSKATWDSEDKKSISLDALTSHIHDSFYKQFERRDLVVEERGAGWIRETYSDHVIVDRDNKYFKVPYTTGLEGEIIFADLSSWTEVKQEWAESKSRLTVYKSGDTWRWLAISNVAIRDREGEIITEKAYSDAIAYARKHGAGELDLVHVNGTDVGDCDLQHVLNGQLLEGGPWHGTKRAISAREAIQLDPDYWGVSIKFEYDPDRFDGQVYHGGIRILKRSILPRHMAASYGTAIAVTGGEQMSKQIDEETKEALGKLGVSDEEIVALTEKQVEDKSNIKTKEEETEPELMPEVTVSIPQKATFLQGLKASVETFTKNWFTTEVVESTEPETTVPAVEEQPPAEKEVEPEVEKVTEQGTEDDQVKAVTEVFGQAVAKAVQEAVTPLQEAIAQYRAKLSAVEKRLVEAEKDVETKVNDRLAELPPVVKVQASHVQATETGSGAIGLNVTQQKQVQSYISKMMGDIISEVDKKTSYESKTGKFEI